MAQRYSLPDAVDLVDTALLIFSAVTPNSIVRESCRRFLSAFGTAASLFAFARFSRMGLLL
jgi:hypothetical protein